MFVINQDEVMRTGPSRTNQQLLLRQTRRRQSIAHNLSHFGERRIDAVGRVRVGTYVRPREPADQRRLRIDNRDLCLIGGQSGGNRLAEGSQGGRLTAALTANHQ